MNYFTECCYCRQFQYQSNNKDTRCASCAGWRNAKKNARNERLERDRRSITRMFRLYAKYQFGNILKISKTSLETEMPNHLTYACIKQNVDKKISAVIDSHLKSSNKSILFQKKHDIITKILLDEVQYYNYTKSTQFKEKQKRLKEKQKILKEKQKIKEELESNFEELIEQFKDKIRLRDFTSASTINDQIESVCLTYKDQLIDDSLLRNRQQICHNIINTSLEQLVNDVTIFMIDDIIEKTLEHDSLIKKIIETENQELLRHYMDLAELTNNLNYYASICLEKKLYEMSIMFIQQLKKRDNQIKHNNYKGIYQELPENIEIIKGKECPISHERLDFSLISCSQCKQAANAKAFDNWLNISNSCAFCRQNTSPFYLSKTDT